MPSKLSYRCKRGATTSSFTIADPPKIGSRVEHINGDPERGTVYEVRGTRVRVGWDKSWRDAWYKLWNLRADT